MKPGDLVTIRKWNITLKVPITYIDIYDRTSTALYAKQKKSWERGEIGILLEGIDTVNEMVQVLHNGQIGWVDEEYLATINENFS